MSSFSEKVMMLKILGKTPEWLGSFLSHNVTKGNGNIPEKVIMTTNGNNTGTVCDEAALLKKLEEANRILEADEKSTRTLSGHSNTSKNSGHSGGGHSRRNSGSSIISANSINSNISNLTFEEDPGNCPDDSWVTWGKIVNDWENLIKKRPSYIKDLVRKGIPYHFRGIVWQLLCDAHKSPEKERYAEYIKKTSPCEKVIRRDIARTYPEHDFFKEKDGLGQESLFNVMKAYSLHDREVGYCQGSGFIVGLLLMQMPEEEAFAVFVKIMQEYRLRELFKPSMAELGLCMFQLECMIQELTPELNTHFQSQGFCTTMFASSWFLTLFTTSLPLPLACRIFDIFLSEGIEIIFKVGMAILLIAQEDLMYRDMEEMLKFFQKDVPACHEANPEPLLLTALQVKYNPRKMKKLEKEYNALKTKEQEEQVELRRLRTENRLLRQRIDNLEKETSTLADRLIHDQVIRAQQEEEMYVVRRDLSALKSHHEKTTEKLTQANDLVRDLKDRTSSTDSGVSSGSQNDAVITQLQEELINVRLQEAEQKSAMRELHDRVRELEELNRRLQQEPNSELQTLQEQLIASKLREAESNLSMKELRQRVTDLDKHWQKHQERSSASPKEKSSKAGMQQLADELMSIKLKEAELVADLNEMKQKVMELETQNHICNRQIKRLQSENETLKEKMDEGTEREKDGRNQIKELERKIADLETKKKEDTVMVRIRDAEHSQMIAEMRQRVAELEIENQELVTAGQLQEKGETQELQNRIADLQEEVMTLKMARKLQSLSSLALNHMGLSLDMESDYDTDDMETTITDSKNFHMNDANSLDSDSLGYDGLNDLAVDTMSNLKKHVTLSDFRGLQHDSQQNHIESAMKETVNSYLPPSSTTVTPTHPSDSESINGATNECSSYVLSENLIQK